MDGLKFSESGEQHKVRVGERVRITMVNDTMMDHPMHLHGVFMEIDNGAGPHKPRKHTINVKPAERLSFDFTSTSQATSLSTAMCCITWRWACFASSTCRGTAEEDHMKVRKTMRVLAALAVAAAVPTALAQAQDAPFPLPPKDWPAAVDDRQRFTFLLVDRLEYAAQPGPNVRNWDAQGWVGGDWDKFWFKTEGEDEAGGGTERAELQLLYARRIARFWHAQAGIRREGRPGSWSNAGVLGIQGLAPYWFDVEAMLFAERKGLAGRLDSRRICCSRRSSSCSRASKPRYRVSPIVNVAGAKAFSTLSSACACATRSGRRSLPTLASSGRASSARRRGLLARKVSGCGDPV